MCVSNARRLRPCLLYTPPVAPTDLDVLVSCPECAPRGMHEVLRTPMSGGRRSRNKAAVGEPAAGSLMSNIGEGPTTNTLRKQNCTSNSGSLGLDIDEERRTERNWWRRASALCELSILEYLRGQPRARYRVSSDGRVHAGSRKQTLHYLCRARPRAELKHISKPRKRNQNEIPPVAASEKGVARPEFQLWARAAKGAKRPRKVRAER